MNEDVKETLLNLLIKLDEVCKKHGLTYYLAYGTCLGAVRHGGFIPWDTDADVLMPIEDARKLPLYQDEFGDTYFVQCKDTDPEYPSISYKLCDSSTAYIPKDSRNERYNQGISVDIYPFYNCPKGRLKLQLNIWRSYVYRILVAERGPLHHSSIERRGAELILRLYEGTRRIKKTKKLALKLTNVPKGERILDYYGLDVTLFSAITYKRDWFGNPQDMEFEGHVFWGPADPDKYLTQRYGDYMQLPPEDKRKNPFDEPGLIVDAHKSYLEYYKEFDK